MRDFETWLQRTMDKPDSRTRQAMSYALLAPGKRIRPALLLAALEDYGCPRQAGYPAAAALEMIHSYSLIHDDLPAMDDDDLRRGRPSTHRAFDEATAILAGDALLTQAFETVLGCDRSKVPELVEILSRNAGAEGMILGQTLDLGAEGARDITFAQLEDIDRYKTGCLIAAALEMAAVLAGHEEDQETMRDIGLMLGIEFQIQDDILDVTSTEEVMGKSLSDRDREKSTFLSTLGLNPARDMVKDLDSRIRLLARSLHMEPDRLLQVFDQLLNRSR